MRWSRITLEPSEGVYSDAKFAWCRYQINLPLVSDGRIAYHELRAHPDLSIVERFQPDHGHSRGNFALVENRHTIFWTQGSAPPPPRTRLSFTKIRRGASVVLRPGYGPAQLFDVQAVELVPPASRPIILQQAVGEII